MFAGTLSGFFGIGGGTILVPMLLFIGYEMKPSVGISVVQMVFSSVYGSFLNYKAKSLALRAVFPVAFGGFFGALFSGTLVSNVDAIYLEYAFIMFVAIALVRMAYKPKQYAQEAVAHPVILFMIGTVLGLFSISIGVGGSLLLVPILVGFFHWQLKKAISAGLFFVIFSSSSGFISLAKADQILYTEGLIIGAASLVGVYFGTKLKNKTPDGLQKKVLLLFYTMVLSYLVVRMVG